MIFSARSLILGGIIGTFAIIANMLALVIVGRINERAAENEKVSYLLWNASIRKRYKKLYPEGKLVYVFDLSVALMFACVPLALWSMGFFGGQK